MRRRLHAVLAGLVSVVMLTLGTAAPSVAGDLDDQREQAEARQDAIERALEELGAELEDTGARLVEAYAELKGIQAQIPVAEAQLLKAENELAELQAKAALIAQRLESAEASEKEISDLIAADTTRAEDLRSAIGRMARDAYKGDMATSTMSAVLDASSTDEFVEQSALASVALRTQTQALREVEQLVGVNRNREARLVAVREEITVLKAEADANVAEAEVARKKAADRKAELEALEAEAKATAAEIEREKATQLEQQEDLEAKQRALEADLREIIRKQNAARKAAGENPVGSTRNQPFTNPSSVDPPYKTSSYGMRFHPILQYWRLHAGVDLRTWCNTPIYAAADGTVLWARYRSGYGNQVMINHGYWKGDSLMSSYNHLSSFAVSSGKKVDQGDLIGYAGNTGTSAACHLHFEAYVNGKTVDPWPLIAK